MTDADHNKDKPTIRREMRAMLKAMSDDERHAASHQISTRLMGLDAVRHASTIMLYLPLAMEVDITPVALRSFQRGKVICVPSVNWDRRDMTAVEVSSFDDDVMDVDEHGVRTPRFARPVVPSQIDVALVPGLAFDAAGRRLGRGGGYYDRFLARLRRSALTIGVAFDRQIVDELATLPHDKPVSMVITERRVTSPGNLCRDG